MKILIFILCAVPLSGQIPFSGNRSVKLYLEPREKRERNVTLELTKAIMKRCPTGITVTEEKDSADFRLGIVPSSSTLYRKDGEAEHVFNAKWTVSGLAREVCAYIGTK